MYVLCVSIACTTGEVRISGDMSGGIEMCVKGIFVSVCTGSCEHIGKSPEVSPGSWALLPKHQ